MELPPKCAAINTYVLISALLGQSWDLSQSSLPPRFSSHVEMRFGLKANADVNVACFRFYKHTPPLERLLFVFMSRAISIRDKPDWPLASVASFYFFRFCVYVFVRTSTAWMSNNTRTTQTDTHTRIQHPPTHTFINIIMWHTTTATQKHSSILPGSLSFLFSCSPRTTRLNDSWNCRCDPFCICVCRSLCVCLYTMYVCVTCVSVLVSSARLWQSNIVCQDCGSRCRSVNNLGLNTYKQLRHIAYTPCWTFCQTVDTCKHTPAPHTPHPTPHTAHTHLRITWKCRPKVAAKPIVESDGGCHFEGVANKSKRAEGGRRSGWKCKGAGVLSGLKTGLIERELWPS